MSTKSEALAAKATAFFKPFLAVIAAPVRAAYDVIQNSTVTAALLVAGSWFGSVWLYVDAHAPAWSRNLTAQAVKEEQLNALREKDVIAAAVKIREFVIVAASADAQGLTIKYVPVSDSEGLVAWWGSDDASGLVGPVPLVLDAGGIPQRTQVVTITASQFGAAWTPGRFLSVNIAQPVTVAGIPPVKFREPIVVKVP